MTTLVTGATGFVGLNLVRQLVAKGEKVRVFARPSAKPRLGLADLDVETAAGDVNDPGSLDAAMKGVRRVYHVAGATAQGPWASVRRHLHKVNVAGTHHVCEAARKAGVERLVHTSSIVAVAAGTKEQPATEESTWNLGRIGSPYYETKRDAEAVVREHLALGLDAVIVNPGFMLGPWDVKPTSGVTLLLAMKWKNGIPIAPSGGINALDVEDAAFGHIAAMEKGKRGERYILGNENLRWGDLFALVNDVCGKPAPRFRLPLIPVYPFVLVATQIGRFFPEAFDNYNTTVLRAGANEHYVSPEKARRELGLPATPLRKSAEKALAWFQQHGYLPPPKT